LSFITFLFSDVSLTNDICAPVSINTKPRPFFNCSLRIYISQGLGLVSLDFSLNPLSQFRTSLER
ncbi:hypothetical protein L9F63_022826, partial [Diploptera punctata]